MGNVATGCPEFVNVMNDRVAYTRNSAHGYQYDNEHDLDIVYFGLHLTHLVMHLPILHNSYPWFFKILESYPQ